MNATDPVLTLADVTRVHGTGAAEVHALRGIEPAAGDGPAGPPVCPGCLSASRRIATKPVAATGRIGSIRAGIRRRAPGGRSDGRFADVPLPRHARPAGPRRHLRARSRRRQSLVQPHRHQRRAPRPVASPEQHGPRRKGREAPRHQENYLPLDRAKGLPAQKVGKIRKLKLSSEHNARPHGDVRRRFLYLAARLPRAAGLETARVEQPGRTDDADLRGHDRLSLQLGRTCRTSTVSTAPTRIRSAIRCTRAPIR